MHLQPKYGVFTTPHLIIITHRSASEDNSKRSMSAEVKIYFLQTVFRMSLLLSEEPEKDGRGAGRGRQRSDYFTIF